MPQLKKERKSQMEQEKLSLVVRMFFATIWKNVHYVRTDYRGRHAEILLQATQQRNVIHPECHMDFFFLIVRIAERSARIRAFSGEKPASRNASSLRITENLDAFRVWRVQPFLLGRRRQRAGIHKHAGNRRLPRVEQVGRRFRCGLRSFRCGAGIHARRSKSSIVAGDHEVSSVLLGVIDLHCERQTPTLVPTCCRLQSCRNIDCYIYFAISSKYEIRESLTRMHLMHPE